MEIHDLIKKRYSTVLFSSTPVEKKKIDLLLEAARWAPSAFNEQPWRFIIGIKDKDDKYKKLLDCLNEANQYWAKYAPVLILVIAKKSLSRNSKPNRTFFYDTGMAVGNLLVQATALDLLVHQMGGYDMDIVRSEFNIPEDFEPVVIMAVGYKGKTDDFPDDLQLREKKARIRKHADDFDKFI